MNDPMVLTDEEARLLRWARDDARDGDSVDPKLVALSAFVALSAPRGEHGYLTELGAKVLGDHHLKTRERETRKDDVVDAVSFDRPIQPGSAVRDASGREIGRVATPSEGRVVAPSSRVKVAPRGEWRTIETVDGIASQEHLSRALFIGQLWEELERRAEKRPAGIVVSGIQCWTYTRAPDEVAVVMWNDPAYAKQRAECEKAAERVWSARRISR